MGSTLAGKLKSNVLGYTALVLFVGHSPIVGSLRDVLTALARAGIVAGLVLSYASAYGYLKVFVVAYNQDRSGA